MHILGIDIGGTKIAVCLSNEKGEILASRRIPATATYEEALEKISKAAEDLAGRQGVALQRVAVCGISAPGPLDLEKGQLLRSPNMTWGDQIPIRDDLSHRLGIPAALENDANAGALAEWLFGSGQGKKNLVYLTMSTGVGAGVIADGHLLHGCTGNAGEMGHVVLDVNGPLCNCGLRGCLEAYTGGRAVQQKMQNYLKDYPNHAFFRLPSVDGKLENLNFKALLEGVHARIPLALEWWNEYCMRLAQGIGVVCCAYNPEVIVLGTTSYYAGDTLLAPLQALIPQFTWKEYYTTCTVRTSALGLGIGELAGVSTGFYYLKQHGLMEEK